MSATATDESEVLLSALQYLGVEPLQVVRAQTRGPIIFDPTDPDVFPEGTDNDMRQSFVASISREFHLGEILLPGHDYILVDDRDLRRIFDEAEKIPEVASNPAGHSLSEILAALRRYDEEGGWGKFKKLYPDSRGIVSLSRVAFNCDHTRALVLIAIDFGDSAGYGEYVLFGRNGASWQKVSSQGAWIA